MRKPDFYIVGAPKSGTTALYAYLRQHPQVFMPDFKEPHHFGSDLDFRDQRRPTREAYLALFAAARADQVVGEASVFYLLSERAAREIHEFRPDAKIIAMLRNPVDMIHSFHSQRLYNTTEELPFAEALAAEADRREGRRLPRNVGLFQGLQYRRLGSYAEQVQRFLDVFGREAVHVLLYDDFRADTARAFRETCAFLAVDPDVEVSFAVVNANKEPRIRWLRDLTWRKPEPLRRLALLAVPNAALRVRMARTIRKLNRREAQRSALDPALRAQLTKEFAPDVERLEALLGRDLRAWLPA
jgi:hypothetical protein